MKLPAITNATLTKVESPGFTADYDQPATAGATKWSGSETVYWSEIIDQANVGTNADVILRRYVIVDDSLGVNFAVGDIVTVNRDGNTQTGTIDRVMRTTGTGLMGVVRLVLQNG